MLKIKAREVSSGICFRTMPKTTISSMRPGLAGMPTTIPPYDSRVPSVEPHIGRFGRDQFGGERVQSQVVTLASTSQREERPYAELVKLCRVWYSRGDGEGWEGQLGNF